MITFTLLKVTSIEFGFRMVINESMKMMLRVFGILLMTWVAVLRVDGQDAQRADKYFQYAESFRKEQQTDSALMYYEKAAMEFKSQGRMESFVNSFNQIGILLTRMDDYEKALVFLNEALEAGLSSLDSSHLAVANTYISLGVVARAEGQYERALFYHDKALSIRMRKLGENHAEVATSYGNIGNVYLSSGEWEKAIEAHTKAKNIREKLFGSTSPEISESYTGLGNTYREMKKYDLALEYFSAALNNKIQQRGEGHRELKRYYKNISDMYYLMDNQARGDAFKLKYESIP